jgi:hypothetical protein
MVDLEKTWKRFVEYREFPLDFGLHSLQLDSMNEYLTNLRLFHNTTDCYLSLYSSSWVNGKHIFAPDKRFSCVFFEVDGEGATSTQVLEDAKKKAIQVRDILIALDIKFIILFSGNRSFHFHILLGHNSLPINNFGVAIREFFESLVPFIDMQCVGDVSRVSRIVNTIHSKTGLYVVQVNDIESFTLDMAREPREFSYAESNEWLVDALNLVGGKSTNNSLLVEGQIETLIPYCTLDMIKNLIESGRASTDHITEHMARVHLTASLFKYGYSPKFAGQVFSLATDFNPSKSQTQLQSIWRKLKPYSCKRLKQANLCTQVLDGCPWEY